MLGNQDRFWTMRNLPAAKSVPAKKREKGVEKLGVLACVKEPCRDVFYSKVTNLSEVFFATTSRHMRLTRPASPRGRSLPRAGNASLILGL